jgi:hypothetical protein
MGGVPAGFTPEYVGSFALMVVIMLVIGGVAWFLGRRDTYD